MLAVLALVAWAIATARRNVGPGRPHLVALLHRRAAATRAAPGSRGAWMLALVPPGRCAWQLHHGAQLGAPRGPPLPGDPRAQRAGLRLEEPLPGVRAAGRAGLDGLGAALRRHEPRRPLGVTRHRRPALAAFGIGSRRSADAQLSRFKADPANRAGDGPRRVALHAPPQLLRRVLHLVGLLARGAGRRGGPRWSVFSPLLMTRAAAEGLGRRPAREGHGRAPPGATADYIARTNAFFPGPPREAQREACPARLDDSALLGAAATRARRGPDRRMGFRALLDGEPIGEHRFSVSGEVRERRVQASSPSSSSALPPIATATGHRALARQLPDRARLDHRQ